MAIVDPITWVMFWVDFRGGCTRMMQDVSLVHQSSPRKNTIYQAKPPHHQICEVGSLVACTTISSAKIIIKDKKCIINRKFEIRPQA